MAEQKHSEGVIEKIDNALRKYYAKLDRHNYDDADGKGKFLAFCEANGFDDADVLEELKVNPNDCVLLEFDDEFPLDPNISDTTERNKEIVRILKCFFVYGYFKPKPTYKKLELTMLDNISQEEIRATMAKYNDQMSCFGELASRDKNLMYFLAVSEKHKLPFLTYVVDSYTKDRVKHLNTTGELLSVNQWMKKNKFMKALQQKNHKTATSLEHAINSYCTRIMSRLQLDAPTFRVCDSLQKITEYLVSTALFIQKIMDRLHGYVPFQVDLLIAVNKVTKIINEDSDDTDSDDEDSHEDQKISMKALDPKKDYIGHVQNKLKQYPLLYFPKKDWDIDDTKQSVDATTRILSTKYGDFRNVLMGFKHDNDEKKSNDKYVEFNSKTYPQNKRFEIFVDRREKKPTNDDDNEENKDQITYFQPPNGCNSIESDHVPEIGFELIRKCIIPEKGRNIVATDGLCGQLLCFMFNVNQIDEIRCYLVWNGQTLRFESEHITQILPLFFEKSDENETFVKSQQAQDLERMFEVAINDLRFNPFYAELTEFK